MKNMVDSEKSPKFAGMSYVVNLQHIVISTFGREMSIPEQTKRELYRYIYGIIVNNRSSVLRINGIGNHIHILLNLHSTIAMAQMVQSIKQGSSRWAKGNRELFPSFKGWSKEYYSASVSFADRNSVIEYIKGQEAHHLAHSYDAEINEMLYETGFNPHTI